MNKNNLYCLTFKSILNDNKNYCKNYCNNGEKNKTSNFVLFRLNEVIFIFSNKMLVCKNPDIASRIPCQTLGFCQTLGDTQYLHAA